MPRADGGVEAPKGDVAALVGLGACWLLCRRSLENNIVFEEPIGGAPVWKATATTEYPMAGSTEPPCSAGRRPAESPGVTKATTRVASKGGRSEIEVARVLLFQEFPT
jgi:hypothetical protein